MAEFYGELWGKGKSPATASGRTGGSNNKDKKELLLEEVA